LIFFRWAMVQADYRAGYAPGGPYRWLQNGPRRTHEVLVRRDDQAVAKPGQEQRPDEIPNVRLRRGQVQDEQQQGRPGEHGNQAALDRLAAEAGGEPVAVGRGAQAATGSAR
jgi:hypothetical protein